MVECYAFTALLRISSFTPLMQLPDFDKALDTFGTRKATILSRLMNFYKPGQ